MSASLPETGNRQRVSVLGTSVDITTTSQALDRLVEVRQNPLHLAFVNAHTLNLAAQNPEFRAVLNQAGVVLNDGIGLALAARMRGVKFANNLNGSDFTVEVLRVAAQRNWRVFLFGARPGVAEDAAFKLTTRVPGLKIVGTRNGYDHSRAEDVVKAVRQCEADVIIVALGQPKQEFWLDEHLDATGCRLGLGVGAFLDFASGRVPRAPAWMNRIGAEWIFRLVHEPSRLWRRYVIGNPVFLWHAWRSRDLEGAQAFPARTNQPL